MTWMSTVIRKAINAQKECRLKHFREPKTFYISELFYRELAKQVDFEVARRGSHLIGVKMCIVKNVSKDYFDYSIDWKLDAERLHS